MTYYAPDLPTRRNRDIFEFESTTGEIAGAAFDQAFFENPTTALRRMEEVNKAEYGQDIFAPGTQGSVIGRTDPETPLLSMESAQAKVDQSGLDLKIPQGGIREETLTILMDRKREELERQIILGSAPRWSAPLSILSGFAASALDPINIASGFIPIVGEARYSAMLARASNAAGRFGVRARVGALEGAVGAALVEPLVLAASAQDQADYDMADSLANIAFGTILGGGLHSIGGAAVDALRSRAAAPDVAPSVVPEPVTLADAPQARAVDVLDDSPEAIRTMMARQMEEDILRTAEPVAQRQILEELTAELEPVAAVRRRDVGDLKAEQSVAAKTLDGLDDTFQARAKAFQSDGMTRKQAERAARDAISEDRIAMEQRQAEVEASLAENRAQEKARADLSLVRKGEIPEAYRQRVNERANRLRRGAVKKPLASAIKTARETASEAPHAVRVAALRTGIAQAMRGQPIDVEDLFRMASEPESALASVQSKATGRHVDPEGDAVSKRADETLKAAKDDEAELMQSAADDEAFALEVAEQTGFKPDLDEANALANQAQAYSRAWRAYALCTLRT